MSTQQTNLHPQASHSPSLLLPPALKPGDTVAVLAPSSPQRDDERLRSGIRCLERLGYNVREGKHLWNRYGYLAGTDEERAEDFNAALHDPDVRMIVAGRGGYGATRILDRIDYQALRHDPKIVLGFSDVTAMNLAVLAQVGLVSFSGAMPGVDLWEETPDEFMMQSFLQSISNPTPLGELHPPEGEAITGLHDGVAEGPLIPANLTLLATLCGTPYMPDMSGAILLIEEIGEEAYRVDRLLSQLWNSGVLKDIAGLAFGAFTGTEHKRISVDPLPMEEVFAEYIRRAHVPTISGVPYGHIKQKLTLPVGVTARIDGTKGTLSVLGSALTPLRHEEHKEKGDIV